MARFAGVTVRTLHHYDEIALLSPSGRTAGYRQYDDRDLERLQRILSYRRLGFDLDKIATILDDPDVDPLDHLRRQHELLIDRVRRLQEMVTAVEKTMEAQRMGISLTPDELFEVFGDFGPTEHAEEVQRRWSGTDAYRESQRRTSGYAKADWLRIKDESTAIEQRFVEAMRGGVGAGSDEAMGTAEAHRQHISRWFYDCSHELHRGLGELYVTDPRFTAHYDEAAPGLARFVRDAVVANADRASRS